MFYEIKNLGTLDSLSREMFKEKINLTGCEASINNLPKGIGSPFIHSHKLNEELVIVTKGSGIAYLNGEEIQVKEGSIIRMSPSVRRGFKADNNTSMQFICIQVQENSLVQATKADGIINKDKSSWLK